MQTLWNCAKRNPWEVDTGHTLITFDFMKVYLFSVFVLSFMLAGCGSNHQEELRDLQKISAQEQPLVDSVQLWLPQGTHAAHMMTGQREGERASQLSLKMASSIKENQEWFLEFSQQVPPGQFLPYHENLGLTEAEHREMALLMMNPERVSEDDRNVSIALADQRITFQGDGMFELLNFLTIDVKTLKAHMDLMDEGLVSMELTDTIVISEVQNGLKSPYHGYLWSYQEGQIPTSKEQLDDFDMTFCSVLVAKLERTGQTLVQVDLKIYKAGQQKANRTVPMLFDVK